MIVTVTLNPSLDYIVTADDFRFGRTNRTTSELILPGGKGINVSVVLRALGVESRALGFIAGFVGKEIKRLVDEAGIYSEFIELPEGVSRINLKLKNADGTELNGMGPAIRPEDAQKLYSQMDILGKGDVLVLSGSIPKSMPEDTYLRIMQRMNDRGVLCCVDAAGRQMTDALGARPFLVKPNLAELEEFTGYPLRSGCNDRQTELHEIIAAARKLQNAGARNVLVSMGGRGAMLFTEEGDLFRAQVPAGKLVNSVGAGDSMVAGFLTGWMAEKDYEKAFRLAVAAGSASAYSERLATGEEIRSLCNKVTVEEIAEDTVHSRDI